MLIFIFIVGATLFISAFCSLLEATLYSSRVGAIEAALTGGKLSKLAERFLAMKQHIATPIAAILILNTVANTAGATLSGMYAAETLGPGLVPLFSILLTLGILLFSEILPKTLGAAYWPQLWPVIVHPLAGIQFLLSPVVTLTQKFSNLFMPSSTEPEVTEGEILAMTRIGADAGEITLQERDMVHNIIALEERTIRDICTPRSVMSTLKADMTVADALAAVRENQNQFSRLPIRIENESGIEDIVGYVTVHDLITAEHTQERETPLQTIAKPITAVPDTANCLGVLTTFLKQRRHIALVVDEFGSVFGLVTLEDLVETALGTEIVDETDQVTDLRARARLAARRTDNA